jgi:hypothetical protein
MQPSAVVDFGSFLTEWSKCLTVKHQRDQMYRFGQLDDCGKQWQDVMQAANAKLSNDRDQATRMVAQTYYHRRTGESTTVGVIWDLKETPGWD